MLCLSFQIFYLSLIKNCEKLRHSIYHSLFLFLTFLTYNYNSLSIFLVNQQKANRIKSNGCCKIP